MNLEVFESCETVEEAVAAAKWARFVRFQIFVDLNAEGNRRALLAGHEDKKKHNYANQINNAINSKGGFPEHMARRTEEAVGLPFGWLDQAYPRKEVRASMVRAKRILLRMRLAGLDPADDESKKLLGAKPLEMILGAQTGERGVSRELYETALKSLKRWKKSRGG